MASTVWVRLTIVYDEVGVSCLGLGMAMMPARGEVVTLTPVCYLDKALSGEMCVAYPICVAQ